MTHTQPNVQSIYTSILSSTALPTQEPEILTEAEIAIIQRVIALSLQETHGYAQIKSKGLPTHFRKCIGNMKMTKSKQNCSVCQENFEEGEIIKKLPCKHIFHRECAKSWLKVNHKCPNCRMDLLTYFKQLEKEGKLEEEIGRYGEQSDKRCESKVSVSGYSNWINKIESRM